MFKLWPRRRAAQPVPRNFYDFSTPLPFGPYSSVSVYTGDAATTGDWQFVAFREFTDPDEAILYQAAWQKHAPALDVRLHHDCSSSTEPCYQGSYRDADGSWQDGQPEEITALMIELAPPSAEQLAAQHALEAERARQARAAWEARQPKQVVVAEAGDDCPIAHHPHFLKATQIVHYGGVREAARFHFSDFDGYEPEPVVPTSRALADLDQERAELVRREFTVARRLWQQAAYRRKATRVLRDAADAWPAVADAFDRIEKAWSDLDHPPHGWEVAVKQLLDAHDHAKPVVRDWEYVHARALTTVGAELPEHGDLTLDELRIQLADELGITGAKNWHIGYAEDPTAERRFVEIIDGAGARLDELVQSQRTRLTEITTAAGRTIS
ncbi:hypothetical protein [Amycolatopsis minnesotensis]|uniref:Uncharacterized protein n=1 Tax=Amycolatopsis minnesotensis TaxID=337894 RepID=A0ABN2SAP9_9PSEU